MPITNHENKLNILNELSVFMARLALLQIPVNSRLTKITKKRKWLDFFVRIAFFINIFNSRN